MTLLKNNACQYCMWGCEGTFAILNRKWTDGAHSNLLTARFSMNSLISPVNTTKGVMQKWCVIPELFAENQPAGWQISD